MIVVAGMLKPVDREARKAWCLEQLAQGKILRFFAEKTGIVKHVSRWDEDDSGDLTADWGNGRALLVCWASPLYTVSAMSPEMAEQEKEGMG